MKIGLVTEYFYPNLGGITEHIYHFSCELKKMGHEPVILTSWAGRETEVDLSGLRIIRLGRSLPIPSNGSIARVTLGFNLGRKIKEVIKKEKFDILHIHSPFFPTLAALYQKYSDSITVATFHTDFSKSKLYGLLKNKIRSYFNALDGKIAVSQLCIDSVHPYGLEGEIKIIPNGVDIHQFTSQGPKVDRFNDKKINIFFLSRLEHRNGLEYLIKAFSLIRTQRNDCRLIIGGDGPLKSYYKSLVRSELANDIHFVGSIKGMRPAYYRSSDIFCFPTTKASFGITILEAMATSKPVVAFPLPAIKQLISDGQDGVLCHQIDEHGLVKSINGLLNSPQKRSYYGGQARQKAENYSWDKITRRIVDYYEELKKAS